MATLTAAQVAAMTPQQMAAYISAMQSAQGAKPGLTSLGSASGVGNAQLSGVLDATNGSHLSTTQQLALAGPTFGASLAYNPVKNALSSFWGGGESTQNMQGDEDSSLLSKLGSDSLAASLQNSWANRPAEANYKGQTDSSEPSDFVGYDSSGKWVNNEFAASRNESDLQAPDVAGADANYSLLGDSYANASAAQKAAFQQQMLNDGNWNESKGMLEFGDPSKAQSTWTDTLAEDPSKLSSPSYSLNSSSTSPGTNGSSPSGPSGLNNNLFPNPSQTQAFLGQFKLPAPFQAIANGAPLSSLNAQTALGYPTGTNLGLWPSDGSNLPLLVNPIVSTSPTMAMQKLALLGGSAPDENPAEIKPIPLDNLIAQQRINKTPLE